MGEFSPSAKQNHPDRAFLLGGGRITFGRRSYLKVNTGQHWNSDQEKDQRSPVDGSDSEIVGCVGKETIESARRIVRIDPLTGELKIR